MESRKDTHESGRVMDFGLLDQCIKNHLTDIYKQEYKNLCKSLCVGVQVYDEENDNSFYHKKLFNPKFKSNVGLPTWLGKELFKRFTSDPIVISQTEGGIINPDTKFLVEGRDYITRFTTPHKIFMKDYVDMREEYGISNNKFNISYDLMDNSVFICVELSVKTSGKVLGLPYW